MMNKLLVLMFCIFTVNVHAAVNYTNGNFYITYTDIITSAQGKDLQIDRTYNSMSSEVGWFGFGWGSNYETFLTVSSDGSIVVHENGAGSRTRFVPETSIDPVSASGRITEVMVEQGVIGFREEKSYLDMLTQDADLRQAYARKYGVSVTLAEGTELFSNKRGKQKIVVTDNGYLRISGGGSKTESFSNTGKLNSVKYRNNYQITLIYDRSGYVQVIKDTLGNQLAFERDDNHRVTSVRTMDGQVTRYQYSGQNLVQSTDTNGTVYKYGYDAKHNLTSIDYADGSQTSVTYLKDTQMVDSVTYSDGKVKKFTYGVDHQKPETGYWAGVKTINERGRENEEQYQYVSKDNSDGSEYIYSIKSIRHGVVTETIYNEDSNPLNISRGDNRTSFKYKDGLLIEKENSRGEHYLVEYDESSDKIIKLTTKSGWTEYFYDNEKNLTNVVNDKGTRVNIGYDRLGRIISINSVNDTRNINNQMTMKYNSMGKPTLIKVEGIGAIDVTYDNYGEINSVHSEGGTAIASEVTSTFQNLLALVKPRGIDLDL